MPKRVLIHDDGKFTDRTGVYRLRTPLYEHHLRAGAKCIDFGGWDMPVQYEGILIEHEHTRKKAGIFDIGHMGEFLLKGAGAAAMLDRVVTSRPSTLAVGRCRYGLMLNDAGAVIDDTIIYRLSQDEFMVVVNAGTCGKDLQHLQNLCPKSVVLSDISAQTGKIDIQGPLSFRIVKDIMGLDVTDLKYFGFRSEGQWLVSRTGYTGEAGVEVYADYQHIVPLWEKLLQDVRVKPVGLGARDTLRLESGYALYGHELDESTPALYCGVERFIDWENEFIGKLALLKWKNNPEFSHVGFRANNKSAPRAGESLLQNGEVVGVVTSGSLSPTLGVGIGVGRIKTSVKNNGLPLHVDKGRRTLGVELCEVPFYKGGVLGKPSL